MPAQQPVALRPDSLLMQTAGRARSRLLEVTGDSSRLGGPLDTPDSARGTLRFVPPATRVIWNSQIPYSGNDGPVWAGRGPSVVVSGGATATVRDGAATFDFSFVPSVTYSANEAFQVFPGIEPGRAPFSSPWYGAGTSADLPLRFGASPILRLDPGESSVRVCGHGIVVGAGTRSRWWGPGVRNALVLSNNAPAIPQFFVETTEPVRTRIGHIGATAFVGTLTESLFFDDQPDNDYRSLSGLLVELRPPTVENLSLGLARLVMRRDAGSIDRLFDALVLWEPRRADTGALDDGRSRQRADQLTSLFARWAFPASGFEVHGEWARAEVPRSLSELAVNPHNSHGYTLGAQWAIPGRRADDRIRLEAEVTYLEQSIVFADRRPLPFYTGRATAHGFTQRGQVLGASIGPGSSSQFVGADYVARRWQGGVFAGRTRWENDALYQQGERFLVRHDVTIYSGARGAFTHRLGDVVSEVTVGRRYNYLFQNTGYNPSDGGVPVDVQNVTLTFSLTPRQPPVVRIPR